ncbi:hypothetical protein Tco_0302166, partial [Tanacetum coccineum]
ELRTSPGVLAHFDNRNTTLHQTLDLTVHDLTVHDLDRFFDEIQFVVNLDLTNGIANGSSAMLFFNFET